MTAMPCGRCSDVCGVACPCACHHVPAAVHLDDLDLTLAMANDWLNPAVVRDAPERVPGVIEQLIGHIKVLRSESSVQVLEMRVMELEMDRHVPGRMVCDVCKFQLTTSIMNVATGGFAAPIAPTSEPCPNGCGLLRPLTWRESDQSTTENLRRLFDALEQSVKLQSHYAQLLNLHDGGQRLTFEHPAEWMNRLDELKARQVSR